MCYPFVLTLSIIWTCFVYLQNCKIPCKKKKIEKNVYKITFTKSNAIYSLIFFCTRDLTFTDSMLMLNKPSYGLISKSSVK